MRAIYYPVEHFAESILITGEQAKHLQVVRVKIGEAVLILNGKGVKAFATVAEVTKNSVELVISRTQIEKNIHNIHLAVAVPKKDAFEDILKIAVELGVGCIQPLTSEFSQYEYQAGERINRILESALIQSNNAFLPEILPQMKLEDFLLANKKQLYFFNSRPTENVVCEEVTTDVIILIGPEGGFSEKEIASITSRPAVFSIHMPTPIQRAPTAVASSIGYLLAKLKM